MRTVALLLKRSPWTRHISIPLPSGTICGWLRRSHDWNATQGRQVTVSTAPLQIPFRRPCSIAERYLKHDRAIGVVQRILGALRSMSFALACVVRAAYLALVFTPVLVTFPLALYRQSFAARWSHLVLCSLEWLGPTFVKLGQWVSTRPDIFPLALTQSLSKLHDDVSVLPFDIFQPLLLEKCGDRILLKSDVPIGSGCIAQVYKGHDALSDTAVAIKVRRPAIIPMIEQDLAILTFAARVVDRLVPGMHWLSLPDEVGQFRLLMELQLDFCIEARNLSTFSDNFSGDESVRFPRPYSDLTDDCVLVEEFVDGVPMRKFLELDDPGIRKSIAGMGLAAFLKMMLVHNFIHADLHPGNIMIRYRRSRDSRYLPVSELTDGDGKLVSAKLHQASYRGYHPQLTFIDTGLVTQLSDTNMENFIDLFCAIADGNGSLVASLMVERSRTAPGEPKCVDFPMFEQKMVRVISDIQQETFHLANIKISDVLLDVFSLVREHHVKIESEFTNLIVSIMILEGLGRQLDKDLDLFAAARPFLRNRNKDFYTRHGGIFLKLSAFLEARFWLKKEHEEEHEIVDILTWNNY
eukprot:Partr_v1_DN26612_c3_g2_i1_m68862 putative AarF domain containing kinase 2